MIECRHCHEVLRQPAETVGARCPGCRMPLYEKERQRRHPAASREEHRGDAERDRGRGPQERHREDEHEEGAGELQALRGDRQRMAPDRHPREQDDQPEGVPVLRARGQRVYIDCLQNILGKTLAAAYSARASDYAGVSTPLTWTEIDEGIDREAFTILTVPDRVKKMGDLWMPLRQSRGVDLARVARMANG